MENKPEERHLVDDGDRGACGSCAQETQMQVINDVLQKMQQAKSTDACLLILACGGRSLKASRATLFEDMPGRQKCRPKGCWREKPFPATLRQWPYGKELPALAAAIANGEVFTTGQGKVLDPWFVQAGVQAAVALPVKIGTAHYGFVLFESEAGHHCLPENLTFLHSIANLLGVALLRKQSEEQRRWVSKKDQLTGLINRHQFDEYLKKAMTTAEKLGQQGYLLFIDLDDFKIINEGYGHAYGDALLVEVACYLREEFAGKCEAFRFGGDEFVLLVSPKHGEEASIMMEEIIGRARHPWKVMENEFYCTVSVGVVCFPDGGMVTQDIIRNAEIAIHNAKSLGKNNCVMFSQWMDNDSLRRAELERRLRACIENDFEGFEVYYQPLVNLDGGIIGAEALLRWFDKDGNLTPPSAFIPLAEYLGLIVPLGEFVLRKAAAACRVINQTIPSFKININVSIRQFQQDFLSVLEGALCDTGVNPANLVLEVTEGMLVDDIEQITIVFDQIRQMGLRLAMDDFGTGYSSLSNMRRLPLDLIKIDRSFVVDATHDAYAQSFILLITNLAHSMNRQVCVEGVETAAQYSYCAECRVDHIQGFYFYMPMPQEELHQAIVRDMVREKK